MTSCRILRKSVNAVEWCVPWNKLVSVSASGVDRCTTLVNAGGSVCVDLCFFW